VVDPILIKNQGDLKNEKAGKSVNFDEDLRKKYDPNSVQQVTRGVKIDQTHRYVLTDVNHNDLSLLYGISVKNFI
jgi:hypothetical protein